MKKFKVHARVTKEIEVTGEQYKRLIKASDPNANVDIEDVKLAVAITNMDMCRMNG